MEPTDTPVDGAHADASGGAEDSALSAVAPSPSSMPPPPPLSALPVPPSTNMALVDTEKTNADDEMLPPPPASAEPEADQARPSAVTSDGTAAVHAGDTADNMNARDSRPTMAMLLRQQETIRRDNAEVDAARRCVETPKPLAVDIEMIERQYAAGGDWSDIASCIHQSRTYELPRAKYGLVIETGKTFTKTPLTKIMAALAGKGIATARSTLKDREACLKLESTTVSILGGVYLFKPFDVLASKFFLDVSNVDSDTDTDLILRHLYLLGCEPVYDTFRDVNLATGLASATWRVYFRSRECPPPLVVNGSVCDQLVFSNKLYPAHGKDTPFASERLPFGFRSHHSIELKSPVSPNTGFARSAQTQSATHNTLEDEETKEEGQLQIGAQHGQQPVATQIAKRVIDLDDALSISTFTESGGHVSPPSSPKLPHKPVLMLINGSDGFTTIATANYFQALQTMEVKFESIDATVDKKYGIRHRVRPVDVKRPEALKSSTESAFFVEKHHTKIRKAPKPSPVVEVTESMISVENTALLNTLDDHLEDADKRVDSISKILGNATNPDHIMKKAVESPLAFNSALSLKMAASGNEIEEL
ncbi:Hypothetical protein PHPALM_2390, partial [Phytophthora palmivora]